MCVSGGAGLDTRPRPGARSLLDRRDGAGVALNQRDGAGAVVSGGAGLDTRPRPGARSLLDRRDGAGVALNQRDGAGAVVSGGAGLDTRPRPGARSLLDRRDGEAAALERRGGAGVALDRRDGAAAPPDQPDGWSVCGRTSAAGESGAKRGLPAGEAAIRRFVYGCDGTRSTSSTGPCSTTRPSCMTNTRVATRRTASRSWLMRSTASPASACRATRSSTPSRTCRSSAVVGSSATSTRGDPASAAAITARWRRPPLSSSDRCEARDAGSGIPAAASNSITRARRATGDRSVCSRRASSTSRPTVRSGSSDTSASWLTVPTTPPRIRASARLPAERMSTPSTSRRSAVTREPPPASPTSVRAVTLLPEPDSPTSATTSPASTARVIPLTTSPPSNETLRSRMSTRLTGRAPAAGCRGRGSSCPRRSARSRDPGRRSATRRSGCTCVPRSASPPTPRREAAPRDRGS